MILFASALCMFFMYISGKSLISKTTNLTTDFIVLLFMLAIMIGYVAYISTVLAPTLLAVVGLLCLIFLPLLAGAGIF